MCAKAGREKCTEDKPILPSAFFFKKIFAHFLEKILTFLRFFSIFVPYQLGCVRARCVWTLGAVRIQLYLSVGKGLHNWKKTQ